MRDPGREEYYDYNEEMCFAASHCRRFQRRRNTSSFNMSDYRACDNCVHYTTDRRCVLNSQEQALLGRDLQ